MEMTDELATESNSMPYASKPVSKTKKKKTNLM